MNSQITNGGKCLAAMIISQFIAVAIILAAVLTVKVFASSAYKELKREYASRFFTETTVAQVTDGGEDDAV